MNENIEKVETPENKVATPKSIKEMADSNAALAKSLEGSTEAAAVQALASHDKAEATVEKLTGQLGGAEAGEKGVEVMSGIKNGEKSDEVIADPEKATADLQAKATEFIKNFAKENGLDAGQKIHDSYNSATNEMFTFGREAAAVVKSGDSSKLSNLQNAFSRSTLMIKDLGKILENYENGLRKMGSPEYTKAIDDFNDESRKIEKSAKQQGKLIDRPDFGSKNDQSFNYATFSDRDSARMALKYLKEHNEEMKQALDARVKK